MSKCILCWTHQKWKCFITWRNSHFTNTTANLLWISMNNKHEGENDLDPLRKQLHIYCNKFSSWDDIIVFSFHFKGTLSHINMTFSSETKAITWAIQVQWVQWPFNNLRYCHRLTVPICNYCINRTWLLHFCYC
jgi:hypothetical protein